jgi:hypothetical protein
VIARGAWARVDDLEEREHGEVPSVEGGQALDAGALESGREGGVQDALSAESQG